MRVNIPTDLKEISIVKYMRLLDLFSEENESVLRLRLVSVACDLPISEVNKILFNDLIEISDCIIQVLGERPKLERLYTHDGIEYGFIPNLEEMSTAEYIDLTQYIGTDVLKAMAVMYRPIDKKRKGLYTIQEYNGEFEKYKDFPCSLYIGAMLFFCDLTRDLVKGIPQYLKEVVQQSSGRNGDGTPQLTKLLDEIEQNIMKL